MERFTIKIAGWDDYNPRKDLKNMPWFRIESNIGFSEKLFGLSAEQKWLFVFLLSCAARKNQDNFKSSADFLAHHTGISEKDIILALNLMEDNELIILTRSGNFNNPIGEEKLHLESVPKRREENITEEKRREDRPDVDPDRVFDIWNEMDNLPKIKTRSDERKKAVLAISKKLIFLDSSDKWQNYIRKIAETPFLTGANDRKWLADFDWVINKKNAIKINEGKYSSSAPPYGAPPGNKFDRVVATNQQAMNDLFSGKWDLGEGAA